MQGVADRPLVAANQHKLDRLEKWAERSLGKFSKGKCKVPHPVRNNLLHQYRLGTSQLECNFAKKDPGILLNTKLDVSQQWQRRLLVFSSALN